MLYFVGGASRSGKSQLVRKLLGSRGIPYFPLDALMIACSRRPRLFNTSHQDVPEGRAAALWPFTEDMVNIASYHIDDYAFEGDYVLPANVHAFRGRYPDRRVSAVFLGYADMDPAAKLEDIRRHASPTDWTSERSDEQMLQHIRVHVALSTTLKRQCATFGFGYFELRDDFGAHLDEAYRGLTQWG